MRFIQQLNEAKLHRHMTFDGLDISIEVPADGYRRGKNKKTGEAWAHKIPAHYGYIKGTHSPDGEHLDCYVRKNPKKLARVYVIHQMTVDGSRFDEDKVMLGYSSKAEAVREFKSATFKPSTMYGGCSEFDMEHFQLAAFSASNSHAMLTSDATYQSFKKRGLLGKTIKSPLMIARRVSESLSQGLEAIGDSLYRGPVLESLEWGGLSEGEDAETMLTVAWNHYQGTNLGTLSEEEFRDAALLYIMEADAAATDLEDLFYEDIEECGGSSCHGDDLCDVATDDRATVEEKIEEQSVMETNNFVVVIHTQIMENIGTQQNPSWATAGTEVRLVQEGFSTYGDARVIATKVLTGEIPVNLSEGAYVLGIDVMPTGEYRQFHEAVEADEPKAVEENTEKVFFQQQVMEARKLAGIKNLTMEVGGTPSVHVTRNRLEALTKSFNEALESQVVEAAGENQFPADKLGEAVRYITETKRRNPTASTYNVTRAVCQKIYGDASLAESLLRQAQDQDLDF